MACRFLALAPSIAPLAPFSVCCFRDPIHPHSTESSGLLATSQGRACGVWEVPARQTCCVSTRSTQPPDTQPNQVGIRLISDWPPPPRRPGCCHRATHNSTHFGRWIPTRIRPCRQQQRQTQWPVAAHSQCTGAPGAAPGRQASNFLSLRRLEGKPRALG